MNQPGTPRERNQQDRLTQALIAKGVEFSVAEDKAMMADDDAKQNHWAGALEGITAALALHLDTSEGAALEMILMATENEA